MATFGFYCLIHKSVKIQYSLIYFFSEWSKEDLEKLRLCRNRAYYKVNTKKRQHLQASLSTYLQKEWLSLYPDTGLSPKDLLKVYQDQFEPDSKDQNGISSRGGPGRGRGRGSRGGRGRGVFRGRTTSVPNPNVPVKTSTNLRLEDFKPILSNAIEDHSDKVWTETMMANLMLCNDIVSQRQVSGDKADMSTMLLEEWQKIYSHSTLTARNIKSR